jgi:tetratricopeptide (TPR) repeat protein
MAKQRRAAKPTVSKTRRATRTATKKTVAPKRAAAPKKAAAAAPPKRRVVPVRAPEPPPPAPAPPARKPGFYEAVAIYERGVQALQRHDFHAAAGYFRNVQDGYPEERELLERARLYLRVCERETSRQPPPTPKTPAERVYAATVALNSGDHAGALDHLERALGEDPESDHAHYIMAVALGMRSRVGEALDHLRLAIGLNPDNRGLASQDPDLESIRTHESFRAVLDTPPAPNRRRTARRR